MNRKFLAEKINLFGEKIIFLGEKLFFLGEQTSIDHWNWMFSSLEIWNYSQRISDCTPRFAYAKEKRAPNSLTLSL